MYFLYLCIFVFLYLRTSALPSYLHTMYRCSRAYPLRISFLPKAKNTQDRLVHQIGSDANLTVDLLVATACSSKLWRISSEFCFHNHGHRRALHPTTSPSVSQSVPSADRPADRRHRRRLRQGSPWCRRVERTTATATTTTI